MVVIHVTAIARKEDVQEFEKALHRIAQEAAAMDGCIRYEWYHVPNKQTAYVVYGEFESEHIFEQYRQSNIVKRIGAELIPRLVEKPSFRHYSASLMESS